MRSNKRKKELDRMVLYIFGLLVWTYAFIYFIYPEVVYVNFQFLTFAITIVIGVFTLILHNISKTEFDENEIGWIKTVALIMLLVPPFLLFMSVNINKNPPIGYTQITKNLLYAMASLIFAVELLITVIAYHSISSKGKVSGK